MKRKNAIKQFVVLSLCVLFFITKGQAQEEKRSIVTYSIKQPEYVTPGKPFQLGVSFSVAPDWYIYAPTGNNAAQGFIETNIIFNLPEGVKREGKMKMPDPEFKNGHEVFVGENIVFSQQFLVPRNSGAVGSNAPTGTYAIKAKITWQTCNDKICLPPQTDEVSITIVVKDKEAQTTKKVGVRFETGTWQETLAKAKQENKLVYVDAYTTWCGPCKWMDKEVFPNPKVGAYFNTHFVNAKIDMEKGEGPDIAKQYNIKAFPTSLFVDGDGREVHRFTGSMEAADFIQAAGNALNPATQYSQVLQQYRDGNTDPEFLYGLIYKAKAAGDGPMVSQLTKDYLATQTDWLEPKNTRLIFGDTRTADDPYFQWILDHKQEVIKETGKEIYDTRIGGIYYQLVQKQYPYTNKETLKKDIKAVNKYLKRHMPEQAETFTHKYAINGYIKFQDKEGYAKEMIRRTNKHPLNDANQLNQLAWNFYETYNKPKYLKKALSWALQSVKLSEGYANTDTVAALYFKLGQKDKAKTYAEKAIVLGKAEEQDIAATEKLLANINQM